MSTTIPAPCEGAIIRTAPESQARAGTGIVVTTILGSSIAFIDGSVVTVALPAMQSSLDLAQSSVQWILNAYLLPLGSLLLLAGAGGDRFGQSRLFVLGLLIFGAASVACAAASSVGLLLLGRAAQGVGAALLVPTSLAILGSAFQGERRTMAIATWAAASAVTGAIAPLLGGWLVDARSWRAIFLINPPIVAATLLLAWLFLPARTQSPTAPPRRLDWLGAALISASLGLLSGGLIELGADPRSRMAWTLVACAVVLFALFLAVEAGRADSAMMPLRLFRSSTFSAVNLLTLLLYAALGGLMLLLPFLMIRVARWDAVEAGAALLPLPVIIGLLSRPAGRWSERYGVRVFLVAGPLVVAAGMLLLLRLQAAPVDFAREVLPALVVISTGMGLTVSPLTATVISAVGPGYTGIASGINNAIARIAALIAAALIGPLLHRAGDPVAFVTGLKLTAAASAVVIAAGAIIGAWMLTEHEPTRRRA
jgi:EmrB/QacA subfamily drug resistance transporter